MAVRAGGRIACIIVVCRYPILADGVHPVRASVGGGWRRRVACRAFRNHSGMALKVITINVVIWLDRRKLGMWRSMAGAAEQRPVALAEAIKVLARHRHIGIRGEGGIRH